MEINCGSEVASCHIFPHMGRFYLRTGGSNRILTILTEPKDLTLSNFYYFFSGLSMIQIKESTNSLSLLKLIFFFHSYLMHFRFYLTDKSERLGKSIKVS